MLSTQINVIPSGSLNKAKWDNCINTSHNGLVYATSTYLDAMATHWAGMVLNDYKYVMPLPWRKKMLVQYIYPPAFVQQLGIFSAGDISAEVVSLFIKAIPAKYKYCEMHFNYANLLQGNNVIMRKNYLLNLSPGYDKLYNAYSRSAIRNITKANNAGVTVRDGIAPAAIIQMHRGRFGDNIGATADDYDRFLTLCNTLLQKKQCITAGAYDATGKLIAGSVYFIYKNRVTFILNGNTPESLTCGATHLLKDHVIQKLAGSGYVLDFEGSDFENFARFYRQFGAKEVEHYFTLTINRLPFLLRHLKR
ncbi:MAG TPA: hypothetical protein VG738_12800 [Chitinophagaceae bacterium]|nr:hypothetical protein [Chitinophagaceae bacterium]